VKVFAEILQVVGRGFYTSVGPEVVFHIKMLCLLYYFCKLLSFLFHWEHRSQTGLTSVLK